VNKLATPIMQQAENDDDAPIVQNVKSIDECSFTNTELNSIQLRDIFDNYSIPREAQRELVLFIRTIVKNNLQDYATHTSSKYLKFNAVKK
jgi:hypothetical protein